MNIQKINQTNNSSQPAYKGLHVMDPKVQKQLLTTLNPKQLNNLSKIAKSQEDNSVHILLDSKNGKQLNASLYSPYRIKDFKTEYKQVPFLESKMHFIQRVANTANKYKQQIKNFKVLKLNWIYSVLPEWKDKMNL